MRNVAKAAAVNSMLTPETNPPALSPIMAGASKGRATQAFNQGTMSQGQMNKAHMQADRAIGHTFHTHKGS